MDLKGKRIVVTGSSRGIGAGIAKSLAEHGARVAITCSSSAAAAEKVLKDLPGSGHMITALNVGDSASVDKAFDEIMKQFTPASVMPYP